MIPVSFHHTVLGSVWLAPAKPNDMWEVIKVSCSLVFFVSFWLYLMCNIPPFIFIPLVFIRADPSHLVRVLAIGEWWCVVERKCPPHGVLRSSSVSLWIPQTNCDRENKTHRHPVMFDVFFPLSCLWCSTEMPLVKTDHSQWTKGSTTQKQDISSYVPLF